MIHNSCSSPIGLLLIAAAAVCFVLLTLTRVPLCMLNRGVSGRLCRFPDRDELPDATCCTGMNGESGRGLLSSEELLVSRTRGYCPYVMIERKTAIAEVHERRCSRISAAVDL